VDTIYTGATIKINSSTYTGAITLNISTGTSTIDSVTYYIIEFKSPVTVSGTTNYNIISGDKIIAYKY
jgi:hypothetical protein